MSGFIAAQVGRRLAPTVAVASSSSQRAFSASAVAAKAAGAKAKAAPSGQRKKQGGQFNKNKEGKGGAGGLIHAGGLTLKTTLAKEAADLTDLVQLYPESIVPLNVGKASTFPRNTYDQLKAFGLPRRLASELASGGAPASVIRQPTLELVKALEGAKGASSKDARYILTGTTGAGKSMLLLQAVSYAIESGWIVLYAPSASKWLDSSSSFAYNEKTKSFDQAHLAAELLNKLLTVNRDRVSSLTLEAPVKLGSGAAAREFKAGAKLEEVVALGIKDERVSVAALDAVVSALAAQTKYPVLFAVDDVQALYRTSQYRAPDFTHLEPYHLSTSRLFLDLFAGRRNFKHGAVVGALSWGNTQCPVSDTLLTGLGAETVRPTTPYTKHDEQHLANAKSGIKQVQVPFGMSGKEAGAMFDVWTRKGWASNASDEVFLGAFNAAAGNPRELARGWLQSHQSVLV